MDVAKIIHHADLLARTYNLRDSFSATEYHGKSRNGTIEDVFVHIIAADSPMFDYLERWCSGNHLYFSKRSNRWFKCPKHLTSILISDRPFGLRNKKTKHKGLN